MSDAPPLLDELAFHLDRLARARHCVPPPVPPPEALRAIKVRRFAGPALYADRLTHIRVAHLTDLHVGAVTPLKIQRAAVEIANAAQPDLVVITGDFVCHSQRYLDELTDVLSGFHAPVFAVLGNHDHWSGAREVRWALKRAGVEVLDNRHTTITVRHQELQIVGLDDAYTGHADCERAVSGLRHDVPALGLSHIAEEADVLWRHGVPLVLSGHTHAGQITLARLHEISVGKIAGHKYVHGLYGTRRKGVEGQGAVYVGAGIGAAVMPLRLGERGQREVTLFELGAEAGPFDEDHSEQQPLEGRKPSPELIAKRKAVAARKRERLDQRAQERLEREKARQAQGKGSGETQ